MSNKTRCPKCSALWFIESFKNKLKFLLWQGYIVQYFITYFEIMLPSKLYSVINLIHIYLVLYVAAKRLGVLKLWPAVYRGTPVMYFCFLSNYLAYQNAAFWHSVTYPVNSLFNCYWFAIRISCNLNTLFHWYKNPHLILQISTFGVCCRSRRQVRWVCFFCCIFAFVFVFVWFCVWFRCLEQYVL